jgi:predicted lipid-binding transport protein (Tim44 family)
MKKTIKLLALAAVFFLVSATVFEPLLYARAGGGNSFGGGSFRSSPSRSNSFSGQRNYSEPQQQPQRGSMFRSIAGGIAGGLIGGMIFRSLGMGGMGGGSMGGVLQILIIAGIGFVIFRFIQSRTVQRTSDSSSQGINTSGFFKGRSESVTQSGLASIVESDPSFNETSFKDTVMDIFFKIQAAWMNRDLSSASHLLDDKMKDYLQDDIDKLKSSGKINKLENIAVRSITIDEAWQESGSDCITVLIYANILDYTVDDKNGNIVEGSRTEPVKFEEYWTFYRPTRTGQWKLSSIDQK